MTIDWREGLRALGRNALLGACIIAIIIAIVSATVLLFWLIVVVPVARADSILSVPLSLERARLLVSAMGLNVGKVFPDDENRYMVSRVESTSRRPNVFLVEIEITRLPRHIGANQ
jgi:hypothetical protein